MQMRWDLRKRICPINGVAHDLCETINAAPPPFFAPQLKILATLTILSPFLFQGSVINSKRRSDLTYNGLRTENRLQGSLGSVNKCTASSKIRLVTIGILLYRFRGYYSNSEAVGSFNLREYIMLTEMKW